MRNHNKVGTKFPRGFLHSPRGNYLHRTAAFKDCTSVDEVIVCFSSREFIQSAVFFHILSLDQKRDRYHSHSPESVMILLKCNSL